MTERVQRQQRGKLPRQIGVHELPDPFGLAQVLQAVAPEVEQGDAVAQPISDESGRDVRDEHLPAVPARSKTCATDHGQAEVVALVA